MPNFIPDDPEAAALGSDLAWPFALDAQGDLAVVSGVANLETALVHRAITGRGEILHRPEYGIDFSDMRNGPALDVERAALRARLLEQYKRDDRVSDVRVNVTADAGDVVVQLVGTATTGSAFGARVEFEG